MEEQWHSRNKETHIDSAYIDSEEYRRKFDNISDNLKLNDLLYTLAVSMLKHRSGTCCEDMYWIKPDDAEVIIQETDGTEEEHVIYSKNTKRIVKEIPGLVTIHNHPNSLPPSRGDFNSNFLNKYGLGVICCHNGRVFIYWSLEKIKKNDYESYVRCYLAQGHEEFDAQWETLNKIANNTNIMFKEVRGDE